MLKLCLMTLAIPFSLAACSGDRDVTSPAPQVTRAQLIEAMSPSAAAAVGSDGKLDLGAPLNTGRTQITGAQAGILAVAVAKYNLPYANKFFDGQRGRPIAYQKLTVCGAPLYASTAFDRLAIDDPATAAHSLQKALGPWWLVKLCGPGTGPQMNIAVSAYSTDLGIAEDGGVDFPAIGGNDFVPEGIPVGQEANELPSPEAAVVLAASLSGRRVAAVPELIAPFFRNGSPFGARWRMRLDGPARIRGASGQSMESSEVFISRVRATTRSQATRSWTADPAQPADVEVTFVPQLIVGEHMDAFLQRQKEGTRIMSAVRRVGVPISFSPATITP